MGITQHLEGMSEEKKALAVAKCKNSTSFAMGFRICGIKVIISTFIGSVISSHRYIIDRRANMNHGIDFGGGMYHLKRLCTQLASFSNSRHTKNY